VLTLASSFASLKAWTAPFDEKKHLSLDGADLAPRFSHTPNWRAALVAGTLVEV
jgi:hypothetical protein